MDHVLFKSCFETRRLELEFAQKIRKARTHAELSRLEKELNIILPGAMEHFLFKSRFETRRQMTGSFFEDAKLLYELRPADFPSEKDFETLRREKTPVMYKYIVEVAEHKTGGKLQRIYTDSVGSNRDFLGRPDLFGFPGTWRARIFLDSKTCGPAWGHMAELATGKITSTNDEDEKNQIRILRVMGGQQSKTECLRRDIHNYVPLRPSYRDHYDNKPQLMLIPSLPLDKILNWKGNEAYDVVVFVSSPHERGEGNYTCEQLYEELLKFDFWDQFDEKKNVCSEQELEQAFTLLRHFIKALVFSLELGISQSLLDFEETARSKNSSESSENSSNSNSTEDKSIGSSGKSPRHPSPPHSVGQAGGSEFNKVSSIEKLDKALEELKTEMKLPYFKRGTGELRPVLKVRFDGSACSIIPDPWLLMVKAAVNFSWVAYGFKLLPAYTPPLDYANEEYEEALLEYEQRGRKCEIIPNTLTIPATPLASTGRGHAAAVGVSTPPAEVTQSAIVTPPGDMVGSDEKWETLSDLSS